MVGLALLLTQSLGTSSSPVVQAQLAELIRFRETCRAFMIAAEETGFETPGGLFKPNNVFVDFGRAHYLENQHEMVNTVIDFCSIGWRNMVRPKTRPCSSSAIQMRRRSMLLM